MENNTTKNYDFTTFAGMLKALPDDKSCREYLEHRLWNDIPVCAHCGNADEKHYRLKRKGEFKGLHKCKDCKKTFTVTVGTMFESSHIGLKDWFIAIFMFASHKKGISSHQLATDLGITQKSSWFMLSRIRKAFEVKGEMDKMFGVISCDETFIGGKNKNRHRDKKVEKNQGRSFKDKTPVFGVMSYKGEIRTKVVPDTKTETLKPIIKEWVQEGSVFVSDDWGAYTGLENDYKHIVVRHDQGLYVNGAFSSNNVENAWSHLKRTILGTYHNVSREHLHRYCAEFDFRFNAREKTSKDIFDNSLNQAVNSRLKYKDLIVPKTAEAKVRFVKKSLRIGFIL